MQDESDVFWNRGMGGAGVLTVNYFVKVLGVFDICRLQEGAPFRFSNANSLNRLHPDTVWHGKFPVKRQARTLQQGRSIVITIIDPIMVIPASGKASYLSKRK